MAKLLKLRRGTTSQHSSFTGAEGEVTVDTDKETLVVHNGAQAGGYPLARADGTGTTNFTITGELDAATGDFSGDVDIDGTANLDAVDIDGAVQIDSTVTVGVNDTGYDVKFFGATAGAYMLWDESVDDLILAGAARAVIPDGQLVLGSTAVTSTAAELNQLDGKTAVNIADTQTVTGSKSFDAVKVAKGTVFTHTAQTTGNITFDFANGNNQKVTLTGNPAFVEPNNQVAGQSGSIFIIQDGTGSRVASSWHADWKFAGGTDPVLSTGANAVDRLDYIILADNSVHGVLTKAVA